MTSDFGLCLCDTGTSPAYNLYTERKQHMMSIIKQHSNTY